MARPVASSTMAGSQAPSDVTQSQTVSIGAMEQVQSPHVSVQSSLAPAMSIGSGLPSAPRETLVSAIPSYSSPVLSDSSVLSFRLAGTVVTSSHPSHNTDMEDFDSLRAGAVPTGIVHASTPGRGTGLDGTMHTGTVQAESVQMAHTREAMPRAGSGQMAHGMEPIFPVTEIDHRAALPLIGSSYMAPMDSREPLPLAYNTASVSGDPRFLQSMGYSQTGYAYPTHASMPYHTYAPQGHYPQGTMWQQAGTGTTMPYPPQSYPVPSDVTGQPWRHEQLPVTPGHTQGTQERAPASREQVLTQGSMGTEGFFPGFSMQMSASSRSDRVIHDTGPSYVAPAHASNVRDGALFLSVNASEFIPGEGLRADGRTTHGLRGSTEPNAPASIMLHEFHSYSSSTDRVSDPRVGGVRVGSFESQLQNQGNSVESAELAAKGHGAIEHGSSVHTSESVHGYDVGQPFDDDDNECDGEAGDGDHARDGLGVDDGDAEREGDASKCVHHDHAGGLGDGAQGQGHSVGGKRRRPRGGRNRRRPGPRADFAQFVCVCVGGGLCVCARVCVCVFIFDEGILATLSYSGVVSPYP